MADMKVGRIEQLTHTPGPWQLVSRTLRWTSNNEPYAVIQTPRAAIDIIGPGVMQEQHLANARLMAAAPDLLAALKLMAMQFVAGELCWCDERAVTQSHEHSAPCLAARAAIKKVEAQ